MPGSRTSRIRQLGVLLRGLVRNSRAVPKHLESRPTDSSRSWRDSRISLSSSTMNTVGTSCVPITTRLNQSHSVQPLLDNTGSIVSDVSRLQVLDYRGTVKTFLRNVER